MVLGHILICGGVENSCPGRKIEGRGEKEVLCGGALKLRRVGGYLWEEGGKR